MTAANPIPVEDRTSFFEREGFLSRWLARRLPAGDLDFALPRLRELGASAAAEMRELSAIADRDGPKLVNFDARGERIDRIDYHPAYKRLEQLGYGSGCIAIKYDQDARRAHGASLHAIGFALGFTVAQSESGLYCPMCMTDGVARILERTKDPFFEPFVKSLCFTDVAERCTGAMFLTEKQGGSDVGATTTLAHDTGDGRSFRLTGAKWFCSNADAELALALARPERAPQGTRGLGLFLIPRELPDGSRNSGVRIERLKDKLGVRSMPTAEIELHDAFAWRVGAVDQGFKQMAEMLNLSRLYNAVASAAICSRVSLEAESYAHGRRAFGRRVDEHALAREVLAQLRAERAGAIALAFEGVNALDHVDHGDRTGRPDEAARAFLRALTPLVKLFTAKVAVACASEAIEVQGGNGYIETSPLPRLLRDAQVLPIWEGTTNVLVLDLCRTVRGESGHVALLARAREALDRSSHARLGAARDLVQARIARAHDELAAIATTGGDVPPSARATADRTARALQAALLLEAAEKEGPESDEAEAAIRLAALDRAPGIV